MESLSNRLLTDAEKDKFISSLLPELVPLRIKAEISQEELANLIGVSRQTYSALERKIRKMSWSTYLSLIMFYDYNQKTHQMIHSMRIFPYDVIKKFNNGIDSPDIELCSFLEERMKPIVDALDEQALLSIRTMIMVEYARCTSTPGDVVVRSFDGVSFIPTTPENQKATKALKAIKENKNCNDQS